MQEHNTQPGAEPAQPHDANDVTAPDNATDAENGTSYEEGSLEARLAAAEALARDQHDAFLRAKAETDNVRKRASQDLQQARKYALESFAIELIAVKDSLEAGLSVQQGDIDAYRNGMELTLRQLGSVLEKFNVVEIAPAGDRFDPNRHQAISALESDEAPNTVLSVLQKGYALHERVLRPAFVTVAKARQES